MKLKDYIIVVLILMLAFVLNHQSNISAAGTSFANVTVFDGPGGAVRFFDSSTGTLYTYDQDLQKIVRVGQIDELGKPGKEIVKPETIDLQYMKPRQE